MTGENCRTEKKNKKKTEAKRRRNEQKEKKKAREGEEGKKKRRRQEEKKMAKKKKKKAKEEGEEEEEGKRRRRRKRKEWNIHEKPVLSFVLKIEFFASRTENDCHVHYTMSTPVSQTTELNYLCKDCSSSWALEAQKTVTITLIITDQD